MKASTLETRDGRLRLGRFVLDLAAGELLTVSGELAGLRRQALEVLLLLGRNAGHVVGKDELMREIWPGVVVGESSLTHAIADIRRLLGDSEHLLVRNVARRGYMLAPDTAEPVAPPKAETPAGEPKPLRRFANRDRVLVGALLVAALGTAAVWWARDDAREWNSPAAAARMPLPHRAPPFSIAVLPFTIEGDAQDSDWLVDALHGDLITELARYSDSLVIGRDTMATYKGKPADARGVARELGVQHVIRGSFRREGSSIRLNLALLDGDGGMQRWAETFVAERATLPQTLGDFAVQIERVLRGELYRAAVARRGVQSSTQVDADDLAMRAFAQWFRGFNRENVASALAMLERAVELDPDSARAWHGISFMSLNRVLNGWSNDRAAAFQRIEVAAAHLERVDRDGSWTYQAKTIPLFLKGDTEAMLRHTRSWTEHHPVATAFGAYGFALIFNGHFDDAVRAQERALRLSPRDPYRAEWQYRLAMAHFAAGRYELAREWAEVASTTTSVLRWPPMRAAALWQSGRVDAAREQLSLYEAKHGRFDPAQVMTRLPGKAPTWVAARDLLIESLRRIDASRREKVETEIRR